MAGTSQKQHTAVERQFLVEQTTCLGEQCMVNARHKHGKTLRGLGIAQCAVGVILALLALVADFIIQKGSTDFYPYYDSYAGYISIVTLTIASTGIWNGILAIVTGILGIRAMDTPSRCMYISNMMMAIITATTTCCGVVISVIAASLALFGSITMFALHLMVTVLCFAVMIMAIAHFVYSCSATCCESSTVPQQILVDRQLPKAPPQPQYVQRPNGQLMMVVNQPIMPQTVSSVPNAFQEIPTITGQVLQHMPHASAQ